jgi:hypothetical protein
MSKGIASLAKQVAAKGRGGESTLLHIHPSELAGMEAILRQLDPDIQITLNPETGMYEAFSFKKLLGAIGLGLSAALMFTPLAPVGIGGMKASLATVAPTLVKSVLAPALIAGTSGLASGAFAPDQKKGNQQQLSDARKYVEDINKREYARQRFTDFFPPPVNQTQPQQQVQSAQNQGIGAVLPMGTPFLNLRNTLANPTPPDIPEEDTYRAAEGGSLEPEEEKAQQIIRRAMEAIRGEGEDPEGALNTYIAYYGKDALQDLYKRMSGEEAPEEESESPEGLIKGPGNGMDDMATARMARGGQKVLLSNDEFIIPADVVSGLGDGSSEAGARKLYAMMDRVRKDRTGTTKQPGKVKDSRVLPA